MKCPGINIHCAGCKSGGGIIGIVALIIIGIIAAKAGSIAQAFNGLLIWVAWIVPGPILAILIGSRVYYWRTSLKVTRYDDDAPTTPIQIPREQVRRDASYMITSLNGVPAIENRGWKTELNGTPVGQYYIIPPDSQPTGTRKATPRASRPAKPGAHPNRKGVAAWQIFDLIRSQREQASEQIPEEPANKRRSRGGVAGRVREMQQVRDASNKRN